MKKLFPIRRKALFSYLVSYLVILLGSLLIGIVIYSHAVKIVNKEVEKVSNVSLENIKTLLDGKLRETSIVAAILEVDTNVEIAVRSTTPFGQAVDMIAFLRCRELFTRLIAYNPYIADIYLYARKSDVMLSSRFGMNDKDLAIFDAGSAFGITPDEFNGLLGMKVERPFLMLPDEESNTGKRILYIYPVRQSARGNDGIIIIQINTDKLLELVRGTELLNDTGLLVVDRENRMLSTMDEGFDASALQYAGLEMEPMIHVDKDRKYMVYAKASTMSDWKYTFVYNMDQYLNSFNEIRTRTILFLMLFALSGILVSYLLARRNYTPLERLLRKADRFLPGANATEANEFHYLEKSINELYSEKESFSQRLTRQRQVILNSILTQLLKGRVSSYVKIQEVLSSESVTFKSDQFLVVAMSVLDYGILLDESEDEDVDIHSALELTYVIVKNIVEELLGEEQKGFVLELDTLLVCMINVTGDTERATAFVKEVMEKALSVIMSNYKMLIYASVSGVHESLYNLNKCYHEAQDALENSILLGAEAVVTMYGDETDDSAEHKVGRMRLEKRYTIVNSLLSDNYEHAEKMINEFISNTNNKDLNKEFQYRKHTMVDDLFSTLDMISGDNRNILWQEAKNLILDMVQCKNTSEYSLLVHRIFNIFRKIRDEREDQLGNHSKTEEIIQYIREQIHNPNLSVALISDAFGLSLSHVTRLLQGRLGIGTLEYIQRERIKTAKVLLLESSKSVNAIATEVGFYNFRTLNYAFKKYEGITASQFREQIGKVVENQK